MKKINQHILYILLFIGILSSCKIDVKKSQLLATNSIVTTESGKIAGVLLDSTTQLISYKGIPFAAPPVGDLRWKAPQPAPKWDGVKNCFEYGLSAPQTRLTKEKMSEDCLFLNVWTTNQNKKKKQPVMVWIHGGGLNGGSGNMGGLDGSNIAKEGVVYVTINYRLGPWGFLAHPELSAESENGVSGNYGFLDQIAALKWVKNNIAAFGGDSNNVTIFGESAGGTSVTSLCASPMTDGLFHKAIIQSPWLYGFTTRLAQPNITHLKKPLANALSAENFGKKWVDTYAKKEGDGTLLEKMRAMDAIDITLNSPYYETRVTIDNQFLNNYPELIFKEGKQKQIPMMIGTTSEEGNFFMPFIKQKNHTEFTNTIANFYKEGANTVAQNYKNDKIKQGISKFITDSWFLEPARQLIHGAVNSGNKVYQYEFTKANEARPAFGAIHASEIVYVFGNLRKNASDADRELSKNMMAYWTQFAKTGNPNKEGLNNWPSYDMGSRLYQELGTEIKTKNNLRDDECDAINKAKHAVIK